MSGRIGLVLGPMLEAEPVGKRTSRLKANAARYAIATYCERGLNLVSLLILVNLLPPVAYGTLATALAIVTMTGIFVDHGTVMFCVSKLGVSDRLRTLPILPSRLALLPIAVLAAMGAGLLQFGADAHGLIALLAVALVVSAIDQTLRGPLLGIGRSRQEGSALVLQGLGYLSAVGILAITECLSLTTALIAWLASRAVTGTYRLTTLRRALRSIPPAREPQLSLVDFWRGTWPFLSAGLFDAIMFNADVLMLSYMVGPVAVGSYRPNVLLLGTAFLLPVALLRVVVPQLSALTSRDDLVRRATQLFGIFSLLGVASFLIGIPLHEPMLRLLLPDRAGALLPSLWILLFLIPIKMTTLAMTMALLAFGLERPRAWVVGSAALLNLALNFWLIPSLAEQGAALASVTSHAALYIGFMVASPPLRRTGFRIALLICLSFTIILLLQTQPLWLRAVIAAVSAAMADLILTRSWWPLRRTVAT